MSADRRRVNRRDPRKGTNGPGTAPDIDDCLDAVWLLARRNGLSSDQAADVCVVTLLRLRDENNPQQHGATTTDWIMKTAIEQCRTAWQLASWRAATPRQGAVTSLAAIAGGRS